jgi:serpin B
MCDLGMPNAFSDRKADFRYFADRPTFIGLMKQAAKIKVNEEGTEAAAVTVIGMETSLGEPLHDEYIAFHANHPFLYVISEKTTGAVYFIGVYTGY